MIGFVISAIIILWETHIAVLFCDTWLKKRPCRASWLLTVMPYASVNFALVNTVLAGGVTSYKMVVLGALFIVWSFFFWQGGFWPRLMLAITFLSLSSVTDYIFSGLLWQIAGVRYDALLASHFYFILITSISKLSLFGLAYLICHASAISSQVTRNWKDWATLSLVPLALSVLTLYLANILRQRGALGELLWMLSVLVVAIAILYFIKITGADSAAQIAELFQKQHQSLMQQNKAQSKALHDNTNFSLTLYSLLKKGQQQQAKVMLQQHLNRREQVPQRVYVDNPLVDAILNDQYEQAQVQGIKFVVQVCPLEHLDMQLADIAAVFYNLLDNARHACQACTGERCIVVQAVPSGTNYVRLTVRNTYDPTLPQKKTPEDPMKAPEHGYGQQIIREALQKYKCSYMVDQKDGWYRVLALLPCPQPPTTKG